jgi:hypothetical protein
MKVKTNGNATAYRQLLTSDNNTNQTDSFIPSIETLKKIYNEDKNSEMVSTDWVIILVK